jgi:hypothetical protein
MAGFAGALGCFTVIFDHSPVTVRMALWLGVVDSKDMDAVIPIELLSDMKKRSSWVIEDNE